MNVRDFFAGAYMGAFIIFCPYIISQQGFTIKGLIHITFAGFTMSLGAILNQIIPMVLSNE